MAQIKAAAQRVNKKNTKSPRALGLLQMSSNGKATLIPIAIRIDGKFYDAAAYKAAPVPMALDFGTVYEGERTGNSLGLFTINSALHSQAANAAVPWIATGSWLPVGTEATRTGLKAEIVPVGIDTPDAPPRLSKTGAPGKDTPPAAKAPPAATPQTPAAATPSSAPSSGQSPAASNPTTSSAPAPAPTTPPAADSKPKEQTAKPPANDSNSGMGDSNRPRLRRGKPTQPLPDDDVPGYSKPNTTTSPTSGSTAKREDASGKAASPLSPIQQGPIQLVPAISDAAGPDPHSFTFEWTSGDEADRRKQMMDLAKQQLRAYLDAQAKGKIEAKAPAPKKTVGTHKQATKALEPIFENVQMITFDPWTNNQPVMVLSAEAHLPEALATANGSGPNPEAGMQYSITLVARTDIYSNLRKLYAGVTDKYHLDVTPRLELIDAVDMDGDGRGEFLFRETTDAGSGYIVYRPTADTLWKMFDSLNPE